MYVILLILVTLSILVAIGGVWSFANRLYALAAVSFLLATMFACALPSTVTQFYVAGAPINRWVYGASVTYFLGCLGMCLWSFGRWIERPRV